MEMYTNLCGKFPCKLQCLVETEHSIYFKSDKNERTSPSMIYSGVDIAKTINNWIQAFCLFAGVKGEKHPGF